jgi:hypothetical protein
MRRMAARWDTLWSRRESKKVLDKIELDLFIITVTWLVAVAGEKWKEGVLISSYPFLFVQAERLSFTLAEIPI